MIFRQVVQVTAVQLADVEDFGRPGIVACKQPILFHEFVTAEERMIGPELYRGLEEKGVLARRWNGERCLGRLGRQPCERKNNA